MSFLADPFVLLLVIVIAVSVVYYYRSTIVFNRRLKAIEAPREQEEEPVQEVQGNECPRCGRKMEQGYIIGPRGIYWSRNAPFPDITRGSSPFTGFGHLGAEPLTLPSAFGGGGGHLRAHRCPNCNTVYLDLSDKGLGD